MAKLEMEIDFEALGEELAKHDFIEVVRCKDCKHNPAADDNCPLPVQCIVPEGYCHLGEKDVCNKK